MHLPPPLSEVMRLEFNKQCAHSNTHPATWKLDFGQIRIVRMIHEPSRFASESFMGLAVTVLP